MNQSIPSRLWLIRHSAPEAAFARGGRCYGALDVALDPVRFAAAIDSFDALIPLTAAIITSPLARCHALARALCNRSTARSLRIEAQLQEMNFGRWEGLAWSDIPRAEIDAWAAAPLDYKDHGGESVRKLALRVRAALTGLVASADRRDVVCITHNGPARVAMTLAKGAALDSIMGERGIGYGEHINFELDAFAMAMKLVEN